MDIITFFKANQARLKLKMKVSNYAWYHDCEVIVYNGSYIVLVGIARLDAKIRKIIPIKVDNVIIHLKVDSHENNKDL